MSVAATIRPPATARQNRRVALPYSYQTTQYGAIALTIRPRTTLAGSPCLRFKTSLPMLLNVAVRLWSKTMNMDDGVPRIPVQLTPLPDGRTQFNVAWETSTLGAELPDDISEMTKTGWLHPRVTPPRRKVAASRWFLSQLRKCVNNEGAAVMFLEAFLSELRATTFALQTLLHSEPGFTSWYEKQRQKMRADDNLRWLVERAIRHRRRGLCSRAGGFI